MLKAVKSMLIPKVHLLTKQRSIDIYLLALSFVMATVVFMHFNPGALSYDSIRILTQVRSGIWGDAHPPLMAAIWRLVDHVIPGSIGILILNLSLFYGGLFLIFRWSSLRYQAAVLPAFLVVGLFPPVISILGVIWIDITMAGIFLAAIGFFLTGLTQHKTIFRLSFYSLTLFFVSLGIAIRHNGVAAAAPLSALCLFICMQTWLRPLQRFMVAALTGTAVTLLLFLGTKLLSSSFVDVRHHFWRVAAMYDIAGASYNEDKCLISPNIRLNYSLDDIRKLYSPRSLTPLLLGQQIHSLPGQPVVNAKPLAVYQISNDLNPYLLANWMDVIIYHHEAYLKHRYDVFKSLITRGPWGLWAPVYDAVAPNPYGIYKNKQPHLRYFSYIKKLAQKSVVFVPLMYLSMSTFAVVPTLAIGLKLQNKTLLVASGLYASGLTHMISLFFLTGSADFRYSHWMITTTILASSLVILELVHVVINQFKRRKIINN